MIKFLAPQSPHRYSTPRERGVPDGVVAAAAGVVAFILLVYDRYDGDDVSIA